MSKSNSNIIIAIVFGGFIIYRIIYPPHQNDEIAQTILNLSIEVMGSLLLLGMLFILKNIKHLKLFFLSKLYYRNESIRLSIAYVYRINVDGWFLLVKSRVRKTFQPVGGAFKTLPGSERVFSELKVKPDRLINTENGIAKNDLRVRVLGKYLLELIEWFNSKEDREISPWREFCEELIVTGILPFNEFRYIDYKYQGTVISPIISLEQGEKGMYIIEVYDLLINDLQMPIFRELYKKGNTDYFIWVNDYMIQRLGHDEASKTKLFEIANHTRIAQNLKWS